MERMNQQQTDDFENSEDDESEYFTSQMPLKPVEKKSIFKIWGFWMIIGALILAGVLILVYFLMFK